MGKKEKTIEKGKDHISHVIDVDEAWSNRMKNRFFAGNSSKGEDTCYIIYRVPEALRKGHEAAYDPKVVSIGPYHRCKENLKATEELKWQCLRDLFSRNPESSFKNCLKEIKELEAKARRCYSEDLSHIGSNEFVEMMVLDGCFVLQFFLKHRQEFKTMIWMPPVIFHDLFLVENQLPFFILSFLSLFVINYDLIASAEELIGLFLQRNKTIPPGQPIHHLFHFLHMGMCPTVTSPHPKTKSQNLQVEFWFKKLKNLFPFPFLPHLSSSENQSPRTIPSATELQEAGIRFKKTDSSYFLDIKFRNGVMEIPFFTIDHCTDSFYRNLITLEQFHIPIMETYVTSYAFFMDCIINTSEDIAILQQNGIIEHTLGSNQEVAILFNQLCKDVPIQHKINYLSDISINVRNHYLSDVFEEVNRYYQTSWHKWGASLKRDYFSNPWASLSVLDILFSLCLFPPSIAYDSLIHGDCSKDIFIWGCAQDKPQLNRNLNISVSSVRFWHFWYF